MTIHKYPLPKKSAEEQNHFKGKSINPGLVFERFAPWEYIRIKDKIEHLDKRRFFDNIREIATHYDEDFFHNFVNRWRITVRAFSSIEVENLYTDWRFLTGIGINNRTEVGFLFNRYGIPYLPGSACKGIAKAYALRKENLDNPEKDIKEIEKEFSVGTEGSHRTIFGTQDIAGKAIFFDAIPGKYPKLEIDIMTPHFGDYYMKEKWPSDSLGPVPIPFLTVAANQNFKVAVGWKGGKKDKDYNYLKEAAKYLLGGLVKLGAGAKTSAGYGAFYLKKATK